VQRLLMYIITCAGFTLQRRELRHTVCLKQLPRYLRCAGLSQYVGRGVRQLLFGRLLIFGLVLGASELHDHPDTPLWRYKLTLKRVDDALMLAIAIAAGMWTVRVRAQFAKIG
jgi:hypothetical protein